MDQKYKTIETCIGKFMSLSEREIFFNSDKPHNVDVIISFMRKGCYSCNYNNFKSCEEYQPISNYLV